MAESHVGERVAAGRTEVGGVYSSSGQVSVRRKRNARGGLVRDAGRSSEHARRRRRSDTQCQSSRHRPGGQLAAGGLAVAAQAPTSRCAGWLPREDGLLLPPNRTQTYGHTHPGRSRSRSQQRSAVALRRSTVRGASKPSIQFNAPFPPVRISIS